MIFIPFIHIGVMYQNPFNMFVYCFVTDLVQQDGTLLNQPFKYL